MIRPEWQEHIRQMVDDWPPVEPETYARLALLLAHEQPTTRHRVDAPVLPAPQAA